MATPPLRALIRKIEKLSGKCHGCDSRGTTDGQLLDDFAANNSETAFAELVARHGPMVLRVCRRVLHHQQDAEDAFQATFLVLARSCGSIRKREAVADYLHGVAYRTAMKAKRSAARRRNHETRARGKNNGIVPSPTWDDVQTVLDEEIQSLPASFRAAFVLCVLEGKTVPTAAAELGCKEGTVSSRVTRARQRLQQKLLRRGIKLGVLLAALCVAEGVGKAALSAVLSETTIRYGLLGAAGATAAGSIPSHVAALATGVTRAMLLNKAKIATLILLAVGVCFAGAGLLTHRVLRAEEKTAAVGQDSDPDQVRQDRSPDPQAKPAEDTIEVTGRVLDPDGKAVAKARLYRETWPKDIPDGVTGFEMVEAGFADAEGRFRIKLPRAGAASPRPNSLVAIADGFGLNWIELPKDGKSEELTLRLVKDQIVRGRLVNTEGAPLVGVTVQVTDLVEPLADVLTAYQNDGRMPVRGSEKKLLGPLNKVLHVTPTDKEGRFEIAGLGVERVATAEMKSDTAVMPIILIATREGLDTKKLGTGPLAKGGEASARIFGPTFEHVVAPCRLIEGTVLEAGTGNPIAGVNVAARVARQTARGVTDAKGHYRLLGVPKMDTYRIWVVPGKDAPFLPQSLEANDRPGLEPVNCDFQLLRGGIVAGQVLDKTTGKGVYSLVHLVPLPENEAAAKISDLRTSFPPVLTDSEGRFNLVTIPGPNLLVAQVPGLMHKIDGVGVVPYTVAELDEADRKRVKVSETEIPGLRAVLVAGGSEILDHNHGVRVVDVKDEAGPTNFNLTVDPGKTLVVNVEDPEGKPLAGAVAAGLNSFNVVLPLKTAACPVFGLDPERPRKVAFLHLERKLAGVITVRGDEKEPPAIRLGPTAAAVGRLLDGDGKPVNGVTVVPLYADEAINRLVRELYRGGAVVALTDKEGRFRIEGIVPGTKISLKYRKGQEDVIEVNKKERGPLKPGEALDLGDLRVKLPAQ